MNKFILVGLLPIAFGAAGCSRELAVKGAKVADASVEQTITTTSTGSVEARQQAVMGFGATGRIERIYVHAGEVVRPGQLLAKLENRDVQSIYETASKEKQRSKELYAAGLVSKAALEETDKAFEIAKANLDRTEIRAPFKGTVTELNLKVGELAQAYSSSEKPPLRLVDLEPRYIKGQIDEVDLSKVRVGSRARIRIPAVKQQAFSAEIERLVPFVNSTKEQERTAQVELKLLEQAPDLPVGASAEIEIILNYKPSVLAVPSRTVLGTGDVRYVFKIDAGKIKKTPVEVGIGNYDRTEIVSGIKKDDVVVYPGDNELTEGKKAKVELQRWL